VDLFNPMNLHRGVVFVLVLVLGGCPEPEPEPTPMPLVLGEEWARVVDPSVDVFADQRPSDAVCDDFGWGVDPFYQALEVQTDMCDYVTLNQPSLEPVEPGDVVNISGFHNTLTAETPSEGYMAISIDGEIVWEFTAAIPGDAAPIEESFTAERSFALGSDVQLHVHNHGPNTCALVSVMVTHSQ
jgi:hypothetical protein